MTRLLTLAAALALAGLAPAQNLNFGAPPMPSYRVGGGGIDAGLATNVYAMPYSMSYRYAPTFAYANAYGYGAYGSAAYAAPAFGAPAYSYGAAYATTMGYPYAVAYSTYAPGVGYAYTAGYEMPYASAFEAQTSVGPALTGPTPPNYLASVSEFVPYRAAPAAPRAESLAPGTARITLDVPANAEVTVNGQATQQKGSTRVYDTPALDGAGNYAMKVRWNSDGQAVEQTVNVPVRPGATPVVHVFR